jgi:putative DNA primase/helicase
VELPALLDKLDNVRALPSGYSARCPAHDDNVASLMVNKGRTQPIVLHCHAGCPVEAILGALGLSNSDIVGESRVVTSYEYLKADGTSAYIVDRYVNPKTFRVRGHLPPPAERVLYQLPAIVWARSAGAVVWYVEGEKDADRLVSMGLVGTTSVSGAGSWLPHYAQSLVDVALVVVADNDAVGKAHARTVAASARDYAASVRLVVPRHGKDLSDLLDAGYTLDELDDLSETDDLAEYVAANVRTRRVEWAWRGYVPLGKLTLIEGDPGDGKSVLTIDLAARWSSGAPMPDGTEHGGPWPVTLVSAEDDVEDTIVPRLIAAGAALDRVVLVPHGSTPERPFEFASDLQGLERRCLERGTRVIVFDPLTAFLASGTDTHNDMQVRQALYPLKTLAARTRAAVIGVRHLNKGGAGVKAVYRGNGSIAFTGAARVGYLVTQDPDDPTTRLLACVKSNLAVKPPTMRYALESAPDGSPYLAWRGSSELSAQAALDGPQRAASDTPEVQTKRRQRQYEIEFLMDTLANGPMTWNDIVALGKEDGFSEHGLRYARADAGLTKLIGEAGNRDVRWARPSAPPEPLAHLHADLTHRPGPHPDRANGQERAPVSDEARTRVLDQAPDVCQVCGSDGGVIRTYAPYWTVTCLNHDPLVNSGEE